ncbi:MAG: hypothetical protein HY700_21335 [Gemmatimonadetes bacterium]|nr:hypothetical protein [Gemmatimonadota bacterium]
MSSKPIRALLLAALLVTPAAPGTAQEPSTGASDGGRVAGEVLAGGAGSIAATFALAVVGSRLEGDCNCDDPGLMGAVFGGLAGATLGAAIPVYLVGKSGPRKGSFGGALGGAVLGMAAFLVVRPMLQLDPDYTPFWVAFWAFPTAGAVIGYHLSGRPKTLGVTVAPAVYAGSSPGVMATLSF